MNEEQKSNISMLTFAMLGAYHSGQGHAAQDTRVGATFRGAIPAAEQATGVPYDKAQQDAQWCAVQALFMSGYLDYVKQGDLYTNMDGVVVEFRRRPSPRAH